MSECDCDPLDGFVCWDHEMRGTGAPQRAVCAYCQRSIEGGPGCWFQTEPPCFEVCDGGSPTGFHEP